MKLISIIANPHSQTELDQLAECCAAQTMRDRIELCCGVSFIPRPTKQPVKVKVVMAPERTAAAVNAAVEIAEGELKKLLVDGALLLKPNALEMILSLTKNWSLCGYVLNGCPIEPTVPTSPMSGYPRSFSVAWQGRSPFFDESLPVLWASDWAKKMMVQKRDLTIIKEPLVLGVPKKQEDFREMAKVWRKWEGRTAEERGEIRL